MAIVTILGAGRMGTAVTWPLRDNGHEVRLVGTHLDGEIIRSCLDARYHPGLRRRIPDGVQPLFLEQLSEALTGADDLPMLSAIIRAIATDTPLVLPWDDLMGVGQVFV